MDRYPQNKDSGIEWIGEIPSHWEVERLLSSVRGCTNGVWGNEPDGVTDLVCVRVADFNRTKFRVSFKNSTIRSIPMNKRNGRVLKRGDLLLEKSGGGKLQPVGVVVLFNHGIKAVCSNFIARISVDSCCNPVFLTYLHAYLYAIRVNTRSIKQTTGIQNLDSYSYLNERAAFPPLTEQISISKYLDTKTSQIDSLVEKLEQKIELLKEYRTALIIQCVTKGLDRNVEMKDSEIEWIGEIPRHWSISSLKYSLNLIMGQSPETGALNDEGKGIPFLQGCKEFGIRYPNPVQYISSPLKICNQGSILLSVRAPVGRLNYSDQNYCIGRGLCALCAIENISHIKFAQFQMEILIYELERVSSGSTYTAVTVSDIKTLFYIVVPIDEQIQIAKHLDRKTSQIDSLIAKLDRKIELHKEYRQSLISNVVTGKVRVPELAE